MGIEKIKLNNFRNFNKETLSFNENTTVIIGPNASGKTNILEAIFVLATGKSFKARVDEEMVKHGSEISRIEGRIGTLRQTFNYEENNEVLEEKLEVILTRGEINIGTTQVEKVARKKLLINGVPRRLIDFAGNLKVVLFGPWDLDLVTESPSLRRRFLDTVLSQVDRDYRRSIISYEKGLRQRNRLLLRIRDEGISRSQLLFWNQLLIKNGDLITQKRREFFDFVNATASLNDQIFILDYDNSIISEGRLEQYAVEEVAAATTLVGPHRDDFVFKLKNEKTEKQKNERDLSRFGSRGEQRMGILWLKLAELKYIEEKVDGKPTLLLDDIFSELDHEHREIVFGIAKDKQTIITTADPHYIEGIKKVEKILL